MARDVCCGRNVDGECYAEIGDRLGDADHTAIAQIGENTRARFNPETRTVARPVASAIAQVRRSKLCASWFRQVSGGRVVARPFRLARYGSELDETRGGASTVTCAVSDRLI